jgi:hypothetical protein
MGDQPCRKAAAYTGQHKYGTKADRHQASSGIQTNDPVFERPTTFHVLRQRGHCDRHKETSSSVLLLEAKGNRLDLEFVSFPQVNNSRWICVLTYCGFLE